jgi:Family of unknown function (DUF6065)
MPLVCPVCDHTADLFTPAGSLKTETSRRKLRDCPGCGSSEWERLAAAWIAQICRLPRQTRILSLGVSAPLGGYLNNIDGTTLVAAETPDLAGGAFATEAFDLVVLGENASYESRDIAIAIDLRKALKPRGWLIANPLDAEDTARKQSRLGQLGFEAATAEGIAREAIAVAPEQPFLAAQKRHERTVQAASSGTEARRITWYREQGPVPEIRPAPLQRDWMDATPEKYAYRCLPLNIANAQGWELLNIGGFTAIWNGGAGKEAISLAFDDPAYPSAMSHFGSGVLTFSIRGLFRTPPGIDLMVTGPMNRPKPGIQALTGVIETDWSEFGFTMNWLFTDKARTVRFDKGEPFAMLIPIPRALADSLDPVIVEGGEDTDLWRRHMAHRLSRADFIEDLKVADSHARQKGWQRAYFGGPAETLDPEHRTKVRLKPFRKIEE